jgi:hypothetical protein
MLNKCSTTQFWQEILINQIDERITMKMGKYSILDNDKSININI